MDLGRMSQSMATVYGAVLHKLKAAAAAFFLVDGRAVSPAFLLSNVPYVHYNSLVAFVIL